MMRSAEFRYHRATSVADAAAVLRAEGPKAMLLAGGTDIVPNLKRRQQMPKVLVALRRIAALRKVDTAKDGAMTLGACMTLSEAATDPRIRSGHRALHRAAAQVATPQIQNMGTLGGNLCLDTRCNYYNQNYEWRQGISFCMKAPGPTGVAIEKVKDPDAAVCWVAPGSPKCLAVSSTDTAPALIALGARIRLVSKDGEREIPIEELYQDDGMAYMTKRPDEILSAIVLAAPSPRRRSTYWKLRRRDSFDFPVLAVGAAVSLAVDGTVENARVVLGAVASRPILLPECASLTGKKLTDDVIDAFAEQASRFAKPMDNTDFGLSWRKKMAKAFVVGALRELRGDDPSTFGVLGRHVARDLAVVR